MGGARKVPPDRPPIAIAPAESMLLKVSHSVLAGPGLSMLIFGPYGRLWSRDSGAVRPAGLPMV